MSDVPISTTAPNTMRLTKNASIVSAAQNSTREQLSAQIDFRVLATTSSRRSLLVRFERCAFRLVQAIDHRGHFVE
jgi:hypothetical protein